MYGKACDFQIRAQIKNRKFIVNIKCSNYICVFGNQYSIKSDKVYVSFHCSNERRSYFLLLYAAIMALDGPKHEDTARCTMLFPFGKKKAVRCAMLFKSSSETYYDNFGTY